MKNYSKPVSIIALIVQITLWVGTALFAVALVYSFLDPAMEYTLLAGTNSLNIMGLCVENTALTAGLFRIMMVYAITVFTMAAMIARNITLISRNLSRGKDFSEDNTPFSKDNVRMVREIGIFSISITVLGLVFSAIIRAYTGFSAEVSSGTSGLFLGLVVLYLSTIFQYGVSLQKDVEGLV